MKMSIITLLLIAAFSGINAQNFRGSANAMQSFITGNQQFVQSANIHPEQIFTLNQEIFSIRSVVTFGLNSAKDGVIQEEIVAGVIQEELNAGKKPGKSKSITGLFSVVSNKFHLIFRP